MTALNKQALRQLATDAHELGIIKRYSKGLEAQRKFYAAATPLVVRALLDELEAAEHRIAELETRTVQLPPTFWYEHDDLPRDIPVLSRRLVIKALREAGVMFAAGIGVKGE